MLYQILKYPPIDIIIQMVDFLLNEIVPIALLVLFVVYLYIRVIKPYQIFSNYKKIITKQYKTLIHPFKPFGLGVYADYKRDEIKYNDSHHRMKTVYPSYQVSIGTIIGQPIIELIDTELIKEFYERQMEDCYEKAIMNPVTSAIKHIIGTGLVFSQGEQWKMKKKIMSHVFNFDFIKAKIGIICTNFEETFKQVEKSQINLNKNQVKIDLNIFFQKVYGNTVVQSFFGDIKLDKIDGVEVFQFMNHFGQLNAQRSMTLFAFLLGKDFYKYNLRGIDRQVERLSQKFRKFGEQAILNLVQRTKNNKHFDEKSTKGVVELLIKENKLRTQAGPVKKDRDYYTIQDLIDQFTTFFTVGIDTISSTTTLSVYLLAKHPQILQKVRRQIDSVFASPFDINSITYEKLKQLTYMDDVIKEVLRMYGPAGSIFPRVVVKDHYIGKIPIKKGTLVGVLIKPNQFKDQFYTKPFQFNPDRWSERDPLKIDSFSFFPFSSGKRNCIGQHLALIQNKIALVFLLKRYQKITLEKQNYKLYMRTLYASEQMMTTFEKKSQ